VRAAKNGRVFDNFVHPATTEAFDAYSLDKWLLHTFIGDADVRFFWGTRSSWRETKNCANLQQGNFIGGKFAIVFSQGIWMTLNDNGKKDQNTRH
jgi:hypothetical protein